MKFSVLFFICEAFSHFNRAVVHDVASPSRLKRPFFPAYDYTDYPYDENSAVTVL